MRSTLEQAYPALADALPRIPLAELPTPVISDTLDYGGIETPISVKCDNLTSAYYGGNKVRKLEYLLYRARQRGASRVATFGSVGSNHAMATSLFAQREGFSCIAFLAHQTRTPAAARALNRHLEIGTKLVRWGGDLRSRTRIVREHLRGEKTWVIPLGGTCWLGTLGFVDGALELAEQVRQGKLEPPDAVYAAMGTMGTIAGLAIGFALSGLNTTVEAVRVTDRHTANPVALRRLIDKTVLLMRRYGADIPADLGSRCQVSYRPEFFGDGYAKSNPETDAAVAVASDKLGLTLEPTYTGKTFRALLEDRQSRPGRRALFWNTYNSKPLPVDTVRPADVSDCPDDFLSYFD